MDKKRLHRAHGDFSFLGCTFDGFTVYWIDDTESIQQFMDNIKDAVWIGQNLKFDYTQLRKYAYLPQRKKLWDTMLIEQIRYSGYYTEFSLRDLARRYLDVYMEKEVRNEFADSDTLTQEMLEYAAVDVVATWQVYQKQRAEIDENDLNIWKDIELPFLWVLLGMGGIKLDTEKWLALAEKNGKIADEIQAEYGHMEIDSSGKKEKEVFVGINLNSPTQVKKHFAECGVKLKSTGVEELEKIAVKDDGHDSAVIFANHMLKYRTYAKRSSTYGKKFVEDYVEADGKIYGDIFQMGAQTGRTSSRSPNLQNQPNEFEYRDCFIAEEGNCIVVADWGSQEPRIAAYLSQDEKLIEALNSDEKLYVRIARDALGIKITKQSPEYSHIKSTILGLFYGMSAKGLSARIGVSEQEAQEMINSILETYPGVADYIERQKHAKEYVQSIYGRKIWLNHYSNGWLRDALNYPIQSSAADAMKIAAYKFVNGWGRNDGFTTPLRLLVHDELVLEVPKIWCDETKQYLSKIMIDTAEQMHDGIKGSVEVFDGISWSAKH
jgi:DNA polymerase-1